MCTMRAQWHDAMPIYTNRASDWLDREQCIACFCTVVKSCLDAQQRSVHRPVELIYSPTLLMQSPPLLCLFSDAWMPSLCMLLCARPSPS
jgi:hypothetical protein